MRAGALFGACPPLGGPARATPMRGYARHTRGSPMSTAVAPHPTAAAPTAPSAAARRELRAQVARLEARIAELAAEAFPEPVTGPPVSGRRPRPSQPRPASGPRLADLEELEAVRDALVARLAEARAAAERIAARRAAAHARLRAMRADPAAHKWERVRAVDLGERHCGVHQVRPRLGLLGMLMGWWEVKVSGGCPLSAARTMGRHGQAQPQAVGGPTRSGRRRGAA